MEPGKSVETRPSRAEEARRDGGGQQLPAQHSTAAADKDQEPAEDASTRPRVHELEAALQRYRGKRLAIFLKGFPDPDSIASAMAHQHICRGFGIETDIIHFEDLSHHENKAMVKTLEIEITKWVVSLDLSLYAGYCCVDTPNGDLPIPLPQQLHLVSLVDHHKSTSSVVADFVDVRETSGSTSAIYCEYLRHGSVGMGPRDKPSIVLATALMYGIRSDTDDFITARTLDFEASAILEPYVDRELLAVISRQSISSKSMDILQVALDSKSIKGTYCIAGVRFVREEDRDGVGEAADYLLRREGVDTVLVYGIVGGTTIDGSLRTTSHTVDPDKWMKELFGYDQSGKYYGGGRRDKGGFQIPLGVFVRCSDRELIWKIVHTTIEDIFFEKLGTSRDED
ncbi:MAG: bifunctional oligoribonuclease/PAP phosphatase NrnA [Pseudomonadota bacterium]